MLLVEPERLDFMIQTLRDDADALHEVADKLRGERSRIIFYGNRADVMFRELLAWGGYMDSRADEVWNMAGAIAQLQASLRDKLDYVTKCADEGHMFFVRVEQAVRREWDAWQREQASLPPGVTLEPPQEPGTEYRSWLYHPGNVPPRRDVGWHGVNCYLHGKSGFAGVPYGGPAPL